MAQSSIQKGSAPSSHPILTTQRNVSHQTGEQIRPYNKNRLYGALNETISLIVGDDEVPFLTHKGVLSSASPFFEAACKSPETTVVRIPDEPIVVKVILYWMYYNQLCLPAKMFRRPSQTSADGLDSGPGLLVKIWVAGEKYQMPLLRNDIIDALLLWVERGGRIPAHVIQYAWDNTDEDATSWALRHLLIRHVKLNFNYADLSQWKERFSHDFLLQTTESFIRDREVGTLVPDDEELYINGYHCALWHTHGRESMFSCLGSEKKEYILFEDEQC